MKIALALSCLALILSACGAPTSTPTSAPPAVETPAATATRAPVVEATATPIPPTKAPTDTPTATATATRRPRPTPTSSGPLDFQVYIAGCKSVPTPQKNNLLITISVEATGGNGVYRYLHRSVEEPDKFIDITWERGTRLIGEVTVTSGDGQSITKEYDFATGDLVCTQ